MVEFNGSESTRPPKSDTPAESAAPKKEKNLVLKISKEQVPLPVSVVSAEELKKLIDRLLKSNSDLVEETYRSVRRELEKDRTAEEKRENKKKRERTEKSRKAEQQNTVSQDYQDKHLRYLETQSKSLKLNEKLRKEDRSISQRIYDGMMKRREEGKGGTIRGGISETFKAIKGRAADVAKSRVRESGVGKLAQSFGLIEGKESRRLEDTRRRDQDRSISDSYKEDNIELEKTRIKTLRKTKRTKYPRKLGRTASDETEETVTSKREELGEKRKEKFGEEALHRYEERYGERGDYSESTTGILDRFTELTNDLPDGIKTLTKAVEEGDTKVQLTEMLEAMTKKGSIYTHDIRLVESMDNLNNKWDSFLDMIRSGSGLRVTDERAHDLLEKKEELLEQSAESAKSKDELFQRIADPRGHESLSIDILKDRQKGGMIDTLNGKEKSGGIIETMLQAAMKKAGLKKLAATVKKLGIAATKVAVGVAKAAAVAAKVAVAGAAIGAAAGSIYAAVESYKISDMREKNREKSREIEGKRGLVEGDLARSVAERDDSTFSEDDLKRAARSGLHEDFIERGMSDMEVKSVEHQSKMELGRTGQRLSDLEGLKERHEKSDWTDRILDPELRAVDSEQLEEEIRVAKQQKEFQTKVHEGWESERVKRESIIDQTDDLGKDDVELVKDKSHDLGKDDVELVKDRSHELSRVDYDSSVKFKDFDGESIVAEKLDLLIKAVRDTRKESHEDILTMVHQQENMLLSVGAGAGPMSQHMLENV